MPPDSPARNLYCYHHRAYEAWTTGVPGTYGRGRMPKWDGGVDSAGRRHKPVWPAIDAVAAGGACNLATLLESAFHDIEATGPPLPNMVATAKGLARCEDYRQAGPAAAAVRLDCFRREYLLAAERSARLQRIPTSVAAKQALRDGTTQLSPLFRYCASHSMGDAELAARSERLAADELARSWFALTNGWRTFIPSELSRRAARIIAALGADVERSS